MKRSTLSHSLLNIILVFIESALTLLLRLDPELRKAAYPLAKQGTVVALRLYLPHVEVFATFSTKGVLLDAELPVGRSEPDVVINAYSIQVINAITTHDRETTEKLQMRGESVQVQLVKQFIMQLGLGSLIQGLIRKIKGGKGKTKPSDAEMAEKKDHYKERIKEQQAQINTLTIKNRELETTVKELQSKQKTFMIVTVVALVVAVVSIIALLMN
ncbi:MULTISPECIES: hypothetical protein [Psychrobacter]|jgi:hypothetical protein|uniref:Uncharacterized protein n=1 Tax=Psychrobacter pacificensis TaxID=112002 RepID=A0A1G6VXV9_9GAMM|nr:MULTISPECIES: hypothetical protein [Psychrobacter]HBD03256.1 hypothetical protein [Psychrobacter sp.]AOY45140.1 hypothetical protein AOT82_2761 [Psychrobacter sp. AntiMn-1]MDE0844319.1 hypothetical protein [Psychrobacter pacificensis]SDD58263.1 hypothetical protein SAMN05660405_00746 [Psychrobacter pacificensis]GLR28864.1 hypothetical protein GCM10007915_11020 [Psychrobacter pacificensis]|tara:strand:+ start:803 stop:1447 length:645 start_codon:yes stop_codon:yes gene_type:complete